MILTDTEGSGENNEQKYSLHNHNVHAGEMNKKQNRSKCHTLTGLINQSHISLNANYWLIGLSAVLNGKLIINCVFLS